MVSDSSPPPADSASNGGGGNSPRSRGRNLTSPWASVVRGDSEQNSSPTAAAAAAASGAPAFSSSPPPAEQASASDNTVIESTGSEPQPESPDTNGDANAGHPRRPAWNRPLNGVVAEPASVIGGAASWPALSETTRPIPRSPSDVSRPVSDGSAAPSQAPIISQPPQRPATNHAHGNSTGNNQMPGRQRSRNRGGGSGSSGGGSSGSGPSQNTFNQPPPFPVFEATFGVMPAVLDNSVRGARPIGGVGASQSHTGNDHSSQRSNSRRGGYGSRPRGDGGYHNNHGGRREQDRRGDAHHPPQYLAPPMGYMPPPLPPGAGPFMAPPHMRVFPGQMGFDMASPFYYIPTVPPEPFRAMPMVPPPPPMIFPPANDNPLTSMIVKQIDFYFSDENLVKDGFLKSKMDDHGWVPISLIASFRRVEQLTKDISLIYESLRYSTHVEVQGDQIRRRNDWKKWLLSSGSVNLDSGSRTPSSAPENVLAASMQEVSLGDSTTNANGNIDAREGHMEVATGQLPEESTGRGLANGDGTARSPSN